MQFASIALEPQSSSWDANYPLRAGWPKWRLRRRRRRKVCFPRQNSSFKSPNSIKLAHVRQLQRNDWNIFIGLIGDIKTKRLSFYRSVQTDSWPEKLYSDPIRTSSWESMIFWSVNSVWTAPGFWLPAWEQQPLHRGSLLHLQQVCGVFPSLVQSSCSRMLFRVFSKQLRGPLNARPCVAIDLTHTSNASRQLLLVRKHKNHRSKVLK